MVCTHVHLVSRYMDEILFNQYTAKKSMVLFSEAKSSLYNYNYINGRMELTSEILIVIK